MWARARRTNLEAQERAIGADSELTTRVGTGTPDPGRTTLTTMVMLLTPGSASVIALRGRTSSVNLT